MYGSANCPSLSPGSFSAPPRGHLGPATERPLAARAKGALNFAMLRQLSMVRPISSLYLTWYYLILSYLICAAFFSSKKRLRPLQLPPHLCPARLLRVCVVRLRGSSVCACCGSSVPLRATPFRPSNVPLPPAACLAGAARVRQRCPRPVWQRASQPCQGGDCRLGPWEAERRNPNH